MAVSNLLERGIHVQDLQVVEVQRKQKHCSDPRVIYEELTKENSPYPKYFNFKLSDLPTTSEYLLIDVLYKSLTDKSEALQHYEAIKQTDNYDKDTKSWKPGNEFTGYRGFTRPYDQLLGVLIESIFDSEAAKTNYEALKRSSFYHQSSKRWHELTEFGMYYSDSSQHMAEFIEKILPENSEQKFDTAEPIPEVRRF